MICSVWRQFSRNKCRPRSYVNNTATDLNRHHHHHQFSWTDKHQQDEATQHFTHPGLFSGEHSEMEFQNLFLEQGGTIFLKNPVCFYFIFLRIPAPLLPERKPCSWIKHAFCTILDYHYIPMHGEGGWRTMAWWQNLWFAFRKSQVRPSF